MIGTVHTELSAADVQHAAIAIPALAEAMNRYDDKWDRSQAFVLTMLATNHLRQGDIDHGVQTGRKALALANGLKSKRVIDRMKPLQLEAGKSSNSDSRLLAHLIREYRAR
jgi:hypothetical protein